MRGVRQAADLDMIRACVGTVISVILQQMHLEEPFLPGAPNRRDCPANAIVLAIA